MGETSVKKDIYSLLLPITVHIIAHFCLFVNSFSDLSLEFLFLPFATIKTIILQPISN